MKGEHNSGLDAILVKIANLSAINKVEKKNDMSAAFMVGATEYSVPLKENVNVEEEKAKLLKELQHLQGFLTGVRRLCRVLSPGRL